MNAKNSNSDILTLGVYCSGMPSSAALMHNGNLVAAAMEERLTREYRASGYPHAAMQYCLDKVGASLEDLDSIAFGWNPGLNASARYKGGFSARVPSPMGWLYSMPNHVLPRYAKGQSMETVQDFLMDSGDTIRFHYVYHYLAHAANAYYMSPFEECAIFAADAYGEVDSVAWMTARDGRFEVLKRQAFPQSLGGFYSTFTEFLGFTPNKDEWKVMGLAAYGDPGKYKDAIASTIRPTADGSFELDLTCFGFNNFDQKGFFTQRIIDLLGPPRLSGQELDQRHADISAAAQAVTEDILLHCLNSFHKRYPTDNLCLTGGVFMNSLFNGKVEANTPYKKVYISHSPDDSGTSIGAALYSHSKAAAPVRTGRGLGYPYLGPEYDTEDIRARLDGYGIAYKQLDDVIGTTAKLLAEDKIVGWFQGGMEFGQRALGNRSIIANPGRADMKDRINKAVKFREAFRPFAPSVMADEAGRYFEWDGEECPFMERVLAIRPEMREVIPAVTHEDGTGRLQMVRREWNPRYYDLIEAFSKLTGVHVILNTSFNLNGEAIVCSPEDALKTFLCSGMDYLVMDDFLIEK